MGATGLGSWAGKISGRSYDSGRHCDGAAQEGLELGRPSMCRGWGCPKPANAPSALDHPCNTQTQHTPSTRNDDPNKAHADPSTTPGEGSTPTHGAHTPEQSSGGAEGGIGGTRGGIGGTEGEGTGAWGLGGEGRGDLGPLL